MKPHNFHLVDTVGKGLGVKSKDGKINWKNLAFTSAAPRPTIYIFTIDTD